MSSSAPTTSNSPSPGSAYSTTPPSAKTAKTSQSDDDSTLPRLPALEPLSLPASGAPFEDAPEDASPPSTIKTPELETVPEEPSTAPSSPISPKRPKPQLRAPIIEVTFAGPPRNLLVANPDQPRAIYPPTPAPTAANGFSFSPVPSSCGSPTLENANAFDGGGSSGKVSQDGQREFAKEGREGSILGLLTTSCGCWVVMREWCKGPPKDAPASTSGA